MVSEYISPLLKTVVLLKLPIVMAEDKTDPAMNRIPRPVSPADIYPNPGTKNEATPARVGS